MCRHRQVTPTEEAQCCTCATPFGTPGSSFELPTFLIPLCSPRHQFCPFPRHFPLLFFLFYISPLLVITQSSTHDSTVLLCDEPIVPEKGTIPTLPPYQASRLPPYTSGGANAQHAFQRRQWCCSGWGCCPWPHAQRCYYEGTTSKISRLHRHLGFVFLVLLLTPGN